jgi:alanine racemase
MPLRLADLWRAWSRPSYDPLIEVRISGGALRHNLQSFRQAVAPRQVVPVLKAQAYGHGLREVAEALRQEDAPFWCVDSYYEAHLLRRWGFRAPLLVMGFTSERTMADSRLRDVQFSVGALPASQEAARRPQEVQLKVDTGMHRQGVAPSEALAAIGALHAQGHRVVGVFSHLADADVPDSAMTARQVAIWNDLMPRVRAAAPEARWFHLGASAGSAATGADTNVVRLGLGLYGIDPYSGRALGLRPALSLITRIAAVRDVPAGESVGYNATWTAPTNRRVATIPVGYSEGLDRRLSNVGSVLVRGTACPLVGRVSMNMATVDVTDVADAKVGDEVTVFSADASAPNAVAAAAARIGTIPYELLVHIPVHLRRVLVD